MTIPSGRYRPGAALIYIQIPCSSADQERRRKKERRREYARRYKAGKRLPPPQSGFPR